MRIPGRQDAHARLRKRVRRLAERSLRRRGVTLTAITADELRSADGQVFLLHNLIAACAGRPESEWPGMVEAHFGRFMIGTAQPALGEISDRELLAQIRTRLQPPGRPDDPVPATYARPAFDGLVVELNRDLPTTVSWLGDESIAGRDLDFLYQVGQRNTDAEPMHAQLGAEDITSVSGDSFFIASKTLNMPRLLADVGLRAPYGVVFSVPHRQQVYLHPVGAGSADAVGSLAMATLHAAEDPPGGRLSQDTYYWFGGQVQKISRIEAIGNGEGRLVIDVQGDFAEALRQAESIPEQ